MTYHAIRRLCILPLAGFGLLAFGGLLSADAPDQGGGGQGRQGGASVAQLEFLVATNDGTPIVDLKPEEVTIRIGGRERKVTGLELKKVEAGAPAAGGAATGAAPPPFATNAAEPGAGSAQPSRTFFFVFEDESIRPGDERAVRASVDKFLGSIPASDRVGVMTLPKTTVRVDPTTDRARIREAMQQVSGRRPSRDSDSTCRARDTLEGMRSVLMNIRAQGLTTVVLFSAGLESPSGASANIGSAACRITTEHFQGNVSASALSRAHVYVVQAEETVSSRNEGLETFASQLGGGVVLKLVGGASDPLERVTRETSSYYVASFEPTSEDKVGATHRLEIRTSRSGAIARAQGEFAMRAGSGAAAPGAPAGNPRDMLKTTAQYTDVPVRVVGFPSRAAGDKVRVLVLAEPGTPETKFAAAAVGIIDAKNQMRQVPLDEKQLGMSPAIVALEVDPGSYRLRFAATDASGKGGTADYTVDATLKAAGPMKLSGMLLGAMRNNAFAPVMQYKDEDQAIMYVEAYGTIPAGVAVSAKAELVGADGKVIQEIQPGGSQTNEPDKVILTAAIPLKELKPGDYTVRLRFQLQGEPEGEVSHTLRKIQ